MDGEPCKLFSRPAVGTAPLRVVGEEEEDEPETELVYVVVESVPVLVDVVDVEAVDIGDSVVEVVTAAAENAAGVDSWFMKPGGELPNWFRSTRQLSFSELESQVKLGGIGPGSLKECIPRLVRRLMARFIR